MESNLDRFDEAWLREASRIEEEANCDISAGFDWGTNLADYVTSSRSFVDREKLMSVLQEGMGRFLDQEDIEAIANSVQTQALGRLIKKFQSSRSA